MLTTLATGLDVGDVEINQERLVWVDGEEGLRGRAEGQEPHIKRKRVVMI